MRVVGNCLARSHGSKCLLAAVRWCGFFNSLSCLAHLIAASGPWASATLQENRHLLEERNNKNKLRFSGAKMFKGPRTPDFCNTSFCLRPYAVLKGKSQSEWTGSGASNCSCESCSRFWSIKRSRKDKSCTWHDFRKCFGGLLRTFFRARLQLKGRPLPFGE